MQDVMEAEDIRSLIARAREGDREAFGALMAGLKGRLEAFAKKRMGTHLAPDMDVEDVFQETCARAFESLSSFEWRGDDSFVRWLNRIAEHAIVSLARKRRKGGARILFVEHEPGRDDPTPSRILRREERFRRLQEALDALPPGYREAIHLTRLQGLTVREAAERMRRTPKSVMHLLSHGLKKLKESFGDTESLGLPAEDLTRREEDDGA